MEQTAAPPIDKSAWGDGPWQREPDRVDFVHAGFACFALRNPDLGHWCGYVGVPRDHAAYGKKYDDVDVEFHGGLTYAAACRDLICHVPAPGMPDDVWWFGGDFAHLWDLAPALVARERAMGMEHYATRHEMEDVYRELPYVRAEIERLAEQLAAISAAAPSASADAIALTPQPADAPAS